MTNLNKRVFEMLVRVLEFWTTYRELIGKGSRADQLFEEIDAAFQKLSAASRSQAFGKNSVRVSVDDRGRRATACGRCSSRCAGRRR